MTPTISSRSPLFFHIHRFRSSHYIALTNKLQEDATNSPSTSKERINLIIEVIRAGCLAAYYTFNTKELKLAIRAKIDHILDNKLLSTSAFQKEKMILEGIRAWIDAYDWYNAGMYFGVPGFPDETPIEHLPGVRTRKVSFSETNDYCEPPTIKRVNALTLFREEKNQSKSYTEKEIKMEWKKLKSNKPEQVKYYQELARAINEAGNPEKKIKIEWRKRNGC